MAGRSRRIPRYLIGMLVGLVLLASVLLIAVIWALRLSETQVGPDLYVYSGLSANTTVLYTPEGNVVVDPPFWKLGRRLKQRMAERSDQPVSTVINTHYHAVHTHGNVAFLSDGGAVPTFIGASGMREAALEFDGGFWKEEAHLPALPQTLTDVRDFQLPLPGQLVHLVRVGRGHTGADLVVYFPFQRVVVTGDLLFHGYYPTFDRDAGGSVLEWIDTLDRILALGPSKIVPGHGPVTGPAELKAFQGYLRDLVAEVRRLRAEGRSRQEVMEGITLPVHEARLENLWWFSSLARNAGEVFDDLAGNGDATPAPAAIEAQDGTLEEEESGGASESAPEP